VVSICRELLTDPIVEDYAYQATPPPADAHLIEVAYNPGVMDPVAQSARAAMADWGFPAEAVRTLKKYWFDAGWK